MPTMYSYGGCSAQAVWCGWCGWCGVDADSSTATMSASDVWHVWTGTSSDSTASTASFGTTVWKVWTTGGWGSAASSPVARQSTPETSPEERERREAMWRERLEAAERKAKEAQRKAKEADQRAKKLLLQNLDLEQKLEYARKKKFRVRAASGRLYELRHGWAGNVEEIDEQKGRPVRRFCIHPDRQVPVGDNLLAQKLLLETDEEAFRRIANVTQLVSPCAN